MNECIYLGFGILSFMALWHFMVRKTVLDTFRDKLFDLRDEVREYFLEHETLEAHSYAVMRELINRQIRYLDKASMVRLISHQTYLDANPEAREAIAAGGDPFYAETDKEIRSYLETVRTRAYIYTVRYLVCSCIATFTISCLMTPFYFGAKLAGAICHHAALNVRSLHESIYDAMERVGTHISSQPSIEDDARRNDNSVNSDSSKFLAGAGI